MKSKDSEMSESTIICLTKKQDVHIAKNLVQDHAEQGFKLVPENLSLHAWKLTAPDSEILMDMVHKIHNQCEHFWQAMQESQDHYFLCRGWDCEMDDETWAAQ